MFSKRDRLKLEINNRKVTEKSPDSQKLNNTFLNNPANEEEIQREICEDTEIN